MMRGLRHAIEQRWYSRPGFLWLLWPLTPLFRLMAGLRRSAQQKRQQSLPVPVVVVGNITVGGTGKTPLLIDLVKQLQQAGLKPGVISRGYGGSSGESVRLVAPHSRSEEVGDEPLLIAQSTGCPVAVGRDRVAAAWRLLNTGDCTILLSDDGLQHYRLARDLEIVVVDASRGFGNGQCLPVGPLREPIDRLLDVDWVVRNGNHPCPTLAPWSPVPMHLKPAAWVNVKTGERRSLEDKSWLAEPVQAVAGIGNPQRFFRTLGELGLTVYPHGFADHYAFQEADFTAFADQVVLMTSKDAVKCADFARDNWWYLEVVAELPERFRKAFIARGKALISAADSPKAAREQHS